MIRVIRMPPNGTKLTGRERKARKRRRGAVRLSEWLGSIRITRCDLPDHLVRAREQRLRDCEAERLRRLQIDDQLELGRLLDGQAGGLGAF